MCTASVELAALVNMVLLPLSSQMKMYPRLLSWSKYCQKQNKISAPHWIKWPHTESMDVSMQASYIEDSTIVGCTYL